MLDASVTIDDLRKVPRSALVIFHVISRVDEKCATYAGLAHALGVTEMGVKAAVRLGEVAGIFTRIQIGRGRGAKVIVRLTEKAASLDYLIFGESNGSDTK